MKKHLLIHPGITLLFLSLQGMLLAQTPTITSFTPPSGSIGSLVTVTGANLNPVNTMTIGGTAVIVVSYNGPNVVAMIMPGTITGTIAITTQSGTVVSSNNFTVTPSVLPSTQAGLKLVGSGNTGSASQGKAVAISASGTTAIVGGPNDNSGQGACWIYTRIGNSWTQQGTKITGTGFNGIPSPGCSVALSADGNIAIIGGSGDNTEKGAAWIYKRYLNVWSQDTKLVGNSGPVLIYQGASVALSADGNTALIGGPGIFGNSWVFTRSNGGSWSQQGFALSGSGASGVTRQGTSVSLSADGNTALVGGDGDNSNLGAAWVFTRTAGYWSQQGSKLVGSGSSGQSHQGYSVSLSADGNTAPIGANGDSSMLGAAWVFTRTGNTWTQQGNKLVGSGAIGQAKQGSSVSLSADGNIALIGGNGDSSNQGAVWTFKRNGGVWTQQAGKLTAMGNTGAAALGTGVSVSADGTQAFFGGPTDNTGQGSTWAFIGNISSNANLSSLAISAGTLTPSFNMANYLYTDSVPFAVTNIAVTPMLEDTTARIQLRLNGGSFTPISNGSVSASLALITGSNTIELKVTAQSGAVVKVYTLTVTRLGSNANLSNLVSTTGTLNPSFSTNTFYYEDSVNNTLSSFTITPTAFDPLASIGVRINNGNYALISSGTRH